MPTSGPVTDDQARALIHGYHAAVSFMDAQLGRVLDELDRLSLADQTIIVLWGDHGWHLGDHGWWCKHTNFEQANRIPLVIVAPGVAKPGKRATKAMVESVDLYPTLVELAGLPAAEVPQELDGKSFAAVLRDPARAGEDHVFHVYPRGNRIGRAVRTSRYRLVEWKVPGAPAESAEFELYDYEKDPQETRNLAAEQPDVVRRLRAQLAELPEAKAQIRRQATADATGQPKGTNRAALFAQKDANGDGKLSREEFLAGQPDPAEAAKRFPRFDTNQDGVLSRDEFIHQGAPAKP
jgi:iduronate 2-sulfatase